MMEERERRRRGWGEEGGVGAKAGLGRKSGIGENAGLGRRMRGWGEEGGVGEKAGLGGCNTDTLYLCMKLPKIKYKVLKTY